MFFCCCLTRICCCLDRLKYSRKFDPCALFARGSRVLVRSLHASSKFEQGGVSVRPAGVFRTTLDAISTLRVDTVGRHCGWTQRLKQVDCVAVHVALFDFVSPFRGLCKSPDVCDAAFLEKCSVRHVATTRREVAGIF